MFTCSLALLLALAPAQAGMLERLTDTDGSLDKDDHHRSDGQYADIFPVDLQAGDRILVEMESRKFDTFLLITSPTGQAFENDDAGSQKSSQLDLFAEESGTWLVYATSYGAATKGKYDLRISVARGDGTAPPAAQQGSSSTQPPEVASLSPGQPLEGSLAAGDATLDNGEYFDAYLVELQAGQHVAVDMSSPSLDTYLGLLSPSNSGFSNDDWEGSRNHSRYELDVEESGAWTVIATTYAAGDGGPYTLLVDSDATADAFVEAVRTLGGQMGEDDRMVIFYSGHGGRVAHDGPQAADPDGFDETLALYDAQITDDQVAQLLAEIEHGTVLIVFDSCFSGGFSKDLISQPGRMGLFSSHEDVTSAVAGKFRAGGYLSHFIVEAVGERRADDNGDGALTALELSQYLYERYRSDVKSMPSDKSGAYDDIVLTGQNLGYQQIIVDRGGIGPSQVLFAW